MSDLATTLLLIGGFATALGVLRMLSADVRRHAVDPSADSERHDRALGPAGPPLRATDPPTMPTGTT
jgi:hypothetical protein